MELDDFKKQWKEQPGGMIDKETLQRQLKTLRNSGNRIRTIFRIEAIAVSLIYLFFIGVTFLFAGKIAPFFYKIVTVVFLGTATTYYRLYRSQRWISSMDFSKNLVAGLTDFLLYYRKTLRIGLWSSYVITIALFLVFISDPFFRELTLSWQVGGLAYLIMIQLFTISYLKRTYGKEVRVIEKLLAAS